MSKQTINFSQRIIKITSKGGAASAALVDCNIGRFW